MALKIVWTTGAENGFHQIVEYIKLQWTDKELQAFFKETQSFFSLLQNNPRILQPTSTRNNVYRGPMNRLTILTYHYKPRKKEIVLINIRSARQKPFK